MCSSSQKEKDDVMLLGKEPLGKLMSTMHGELCLGESFLTETSTHSIYVPSHGTFFFYYNFKIFASF